MSADLLEAFGPPETKGTSPGVSTTIQVGATTGTSNTSTEPFKTSTYASLSHSSHTSAPSQIAKTEPIFSAGEKGGNDILFDADDKQGASEDDFGDFEDVNEKHQSSSRESLPVESRYRAGDGVSQNTLIDLLSLDDDSPQKPGYHSNTVHKKIANVSDIDFFGTTEQVPQSHQLPDSSSPPASQVAYGDEGWGDFEGVQQSMDVPASESPAKSLGNSRKGFLPSTKPIVYPAQSSGKPIRQPEPDPVENDDWDTFEDGAPYTSAVPQHSVSASANVSTSNAHPSSIPPNAERPTNIPPPAILLALLPTTFTFLIGLILASTHASDQQSIYPQLVTYHRVTCRLISTAVRALRWRRDNILAQSTRISVANKSTSATGTGAMKLSSLNKGEAMREEREAAEAMDVWNQNLHHFSKALSVAKMKLPQGAVLRMSLNTPVKPVSGAGVIQSTFVCALCGLRRNERVVGVDDVGVEDVFGEYWLENWGHRDCAEWWYRWKGELSHR